MKKQKFKQGNLDLVNKYLFWARSSVVERYVDIVEVISSILITPTKKLIILSLKDNLAIYKINNKIYTHCAW